MSTPTNELGTAQPAPPRLRIAAGYKRPLVMQAVATFEAGARRVAEFRGLAASDMRDSQLEACSRARIDMADARTTLGREGLLHLVDRTVPVSTISREALRLRTLMRSADYNPDQAHHVAALETVAGITPGLLADVITGRALIERLPLQRLASVLGVKAVA
ncbi:hypothetical protein AB0953_16620 [Streptomyces sp. NPDC046866]|uniref:hypothetical protein n=1 Tax=Streptomyces sp. NPDC046866 TaxID=3154921 RepID=UPI00345182E5